MKANRRPAVTDTAVADGKQPATAATPTIRMPPPAQRAITAWPVCERPREKLCAEGVGALSNAELLAIILRTGVVGHTSVDLGRTLLSHFGSLRALLDATAAQLVAMHGIGPAKLAQLQTIGELARRALAEKLRETPLLDSPAAVRNYLRLLLGAHERETFFCLYLDARNHLIREEESSRGTLTHTSVYPREIARRALALNAANLIVAHNHPSGCACPSAADQQLTRQLKAALELVEVRLLDHFIVVTNDVFSFVEHGML